MIAFDPETTTEQLHAAIGAMDDHEVEQVLYDWSVFARPGQVWPAGEWRTWLIIGGRGSGKTRPGAEAVRQVAEDPNAVIALIGPTAADVRQVMIEGESGLLNITPPDERPVYKPSIRELRWPSGALGYTYSAEEPERLRGPQHSFAWCLVGDTRVRMADGSERELRDIRVGEFVQTRAGARCVIGHARTRVNSEVWEVRCADGRGIIGTSDHPVWVESRGFIPIAQLRAGMNLCVNSASSGTGMSGIATATDTTHGKSDCIGRSGKRRMGGFQAVSTSTMSMATRQTIASRIWSSCHTASIAVSTFMRKFHRRRTRAGSGHRSLRWHGDGRRIFGANFGALSAARPFGAGRFTRRNTVPRSVSRWRDPVSLSARIAYARDVALRIARDGAFSSIVQRSATRERSRIAHPSVRSDVSYARSVALNLPALAATRDSAIVNALSLSTARIVSVGKLAATADVYDIAIQGDREFFANGILVHNCDEIATYPDLKGLWDLMIPGLRLGMDPRRICTTTPKSLPFLKELMNRPDSVVSRMCTRDNRANLPPSLLEELERIYAGTRIGRQELEGELLEEAEGALWRRAQIDKLRVAAAPALTRVVVALDPSVTNGPESDECGIVAAGLGVDGDGYVLVDRSRKAPPDKWAECGVCTFDELEADKIVAEVNNGGDLVELTLRTVRRSIPYEKLHASRGKITRAEPVAALYEQGKVHHVGGAFAALEDEMCNYVAGVTKSPNRMDALVWAITFLMLKPARVGRALSL